MIAGSDIKLAHSVGKLLIVRMVVLDEVLLDGILLDWAFSCAEETHTTLKLTLYIAPLNRSARCAEGTLKLRIPYVKIGTLCSISRNVHLDIFTSRT
jgi:hypothetical protein